MQRELSYCRRCGNRPLEGVPRYVEIQQAAGRPAFCLSCNYDLSTNYEYWIGNDDACRPALCVRQQAYECRCGWHCQRYIWWPEENQQPCWLYCIEDIYFDNCPSCGRQLYHRVGDLMEV